MTVIAMTQEMATLGKDISDGVAQALNLKVVRHEVGDSVAERMRVQKSLIRRVREGQAGWFEKRDVDPEIFAVYAAEEVLELALEGNVLIRGWGATCLLQAVRHVPCVRVCAPREARLKWLMAKLGSDDDREVAEEELDRSDSAHAARIRQNFGVTLGDALIYDMVLNTARVSIESCVEQIVALSRRPEFQPTAESIAQLRNLTLQTRIRSTFRAHPEAAHINVTAEADDGAVLLRGIVVSTDEKALAATLAAGVPGVRSVDNQLRVMEVGTKRFTGSKYS